MLTLTLTEVALMIKFILNRSWINEKEMLSKLGIFNSVKQCIPRSIHMHKDL